MTYELWKNKTKGACYFVNEAMANVNTLPGTITKKTRYN